MDTPLSTDDRDLVLTRLIPAPRAALYRAWTDPDLLRRWFAPDPYTIARAELDPRPGGGNLVVIRAPDGTEHPHHGVYLEVVENERLVVTDAYRPGWEPSAKPFMTAIITFADEAGGTRYTARARHWSREDRDAHEAMGFHEGWGRCADQLAALAATL
ncbi:SRPBCC family protein [Methylobacterium sp. ID0610]|uniref:SRPBCC family protein n=1 Tax=Methylobacterium carpenticola TaxID=3344827 RepID=UPI0036B56E3F